MEKRAKLAEVYTVICVTETWYSESVPVDEPISDHRSGRKFPEIPGAAQR